MIARRLADRGWRVEVLALGEAGGMPPDARRNREIWERMGREGSIVHAPWPKVDDTPPDP